MARRAPSSTAPRSRRVARGLLALDELAHAGFEDAGQRTALVALGAGALVQGVQVAAGPEAALELFGQAARGADREHLAEDIGPADQRNREQQAMISLHDQVRVGDQFKEGEVLDCVHQYICSNVSVGRILAAVLAGRERGRIVRASTQPTFTFAVDSRVRRARLAGRTGPRRGRAFPRSVSGHFIVQARRRRYSTLALLTTKAAFSSSSRRLLVNAERTQPFGARTFKELQVIGVVHDAAGVGVFVVDPYVQVKTEGISAAINEIGKHFTRFSICLCAERT
jgi:hypothetical protein